MTNFEYNSQKELYVPTKEDIRSVSADRRAVVWNLHDTLVEGPKSMSKIEEELQNIEPQIWDLMKKDPAKALKIVNDVAKASANYNPKVINGANHSLDFIESYGLENVIGTNSFEDQVIRALKESGLDEHISKYILTTDRRIASDDGQPSKKDAKYASLIYHDLKEEGKMPIAYGSHKREEIEDFAMPFFAYAIFIDSKAEKVQFDGKTLVTPRLGFDYRSREDLIQGVELFNALKFICAGI